MELGAFSISLVVSDLQASKSFYEKLGFSVFGGDASQNWLILKNGDVVIGLFVGMFERNMLTFNPGWNSNAQELDTFTDVRDLQRDSGPKVSSSRSKRTKAQQDRPALSWWTPTETRFSSISTSRLLLFQRGAAWGPVVSWPSL